MKILKNFLFGITIVWLLIVAFAFPVYYKQQAKHGIHRWIGELKYIQADIETKIKNRDFDFNSVILPKLTNAHEAFINTDGSIIVTGNEKAYDSLLILIPQLNGENLRWRCFDSEKTTNC